MRRPPLTDALLALGLVALAQGTVWTGDVSGPRALVALIALAMTAPLAWRRAYPLAVFGVVLASVIALGAVDSSLDDLYTLLAPLVAIEAVGAHVVSSATVKTHVGHVLMKPGVRDRVQAVVAAYEAGVVVPGGR